MSRFPCDYCGKPIPLEDDFVDEGIHYHTDCYNEICGEDEKVLGRCPQCNKFVLAYDVILMHSRPYHTSCC